MLFIVAKTIVGKVLKTRLDGAQPAAIKSDIVDFHRRNFKR